jgi:hypothetical protein
MQVSSHASPGADPNPGWRQTAGGKSGCFASGPCSLDTQRCDLTSTADITKGFGVHRVKDPHQTAQTAPQNTGAQIAVPQTADATALIIDNVALHAKMRKG